MSIFGYVVGATMKFLHNLIKKAWQEVPPAFTKQERMILFRNPIPKFMDVVVSISTQVSLQAAAAGFLVFEWRANSLFNPSGSGGTGGSDTQVSYALFGFTGYAIARLMDEETDLFLIGNDSGTPFYIYYGYSDTQPSTKLTTYDKVLANEAGTNVMWRTSVGEIGGMNRAQKLDIYKRIGDVVGSLKNYYSDNDYSTTSTANPSQIVWGYVGVRSPGSAINITNGVLATIVRRARFRFYSSLLDV